MEFLKEFSVELLEKLPVKFPRGNWETRETTWEVEKFTVELLEQFLIEFKKKFVMQLLKEFPT